jgi:uncharacterized repeat protein (TIGR01451 family)
MSEQLEYRNNANYPEYFISPDLHQVIWKFDQLNHGETIEITFDAETVEICNGSNHVIVTTQEQVIYEDTVTVKTIYVPEIIEITKKVWDGTKWADSATFSSSGFMAQFKITVTNHAPLVPLTDVLVTDDLPSFLTYWPVMSFPMPISWSSNYVAWYIPTLPPGASMDIRYYATITLGGVEGDNYAFGIANYGTTIEYDSDSTHIIVN